MPSMRHDYANTPLKLSFLKSCDIFVPFSPIHRNPFIVKRYVIIIVIIIMMRLLHTVTTKEGGRKYENNARSIGLTRKNGC
jgi:hypothetical protein